ncbi:PREDICTED: mediator of DNA damage checkpoint protein 1 isoform X2 [Miniopterus natalensis]|uniref:mediator of DNA damage checkpoint protein 1 isoform X2 n=1 Tax=Miniopterus natalensis TaxID=291302 RepID=UPI0007A6D072|nr:PREDICTED: mediator of DNA damage checkpoint protein 1 isoform X2 [Miniopterus natalensis]
MEDTQAINWEVDEEEETERPSDSSECSLQPLGRLRVFSSAHGPEKDFPLYLGKNVIGRMPDCSVALPFPSISKQHAVIEILARDKAPVLWDCGSLNGTQILRPPKFLSPGVSHRLRDQEFVVFADLPCQYHRLDVSLPFVSRGPLTVEETPRVQGGTRPWGILLAEDSEDEVDRPSERYMVKEPRTTSSPLATVVPESDEEGPSSAPDGPGPPCTFNLDSDTDEEESQQPAAGEASSAATRDATAETEQRRAVTTEIQFEKDQTSGQERNSDTRVERDAGNGVILERSQPTGEDSETDVDESRPPGRPADVHLDRAQPSGFIDSDTDVEEEGIPATPAVVPVQKTQIFHGVCTGSPGGPDLAHLQESPAGSDTDIEDAEAPLVALVQSQASVLSASNTDKQEVSAVLTLAHLKESQAPAWNRNTDVQEDAAQPPALHERSRTSAGRGSDTDEGGGNLVEKRDCVPKDYADKAHSEKSQPPFRDSDIEVEEGKSSPGVHLERSQASATAGFNTQVEKEVPPGPAATLPEKHQEPVTWKNPTNVEAEGGPTKLPAVWPPPGGDCGTTAEESVSLSASTVTGVRKSQLPAEGDAGTEWVVPVLQQERALEAAAQGGSPLAQVEQDHLLISRESLTGLLVDTGTAGEPTQPQRKGAQPPREGGREPHVDMTKDSGHNHDDSKDLDLQATQCFVERENLSLEGALDEPLEILATQPYCLRESEASETQPIAAYLEAHGSCPFSPWPTPRDQHPESPDHAEPLGIEDRGLQTAEKGHSCKMPPAEKPSRGDPESLDACLPPAVPEASGPVQSPLISQPQNHPASQPCFAPSPPSLEPLIPRAGQNESQEVPENPLSSELDPLHAKPKVRPQGCSRMIPSPASSISLEPPPTTPTDQPISPEPTSQATRDRTHRASIKAPEPSVPTAAELYPTTPTDQLITPEPTSRGKTQRASVKTPEPTVPTAPELHPNTPKEQPITPEPTSQATRDRTHRASVKAHEPTVPTAPTEQAITPEPTSQATRGRTHRASVKTPEPTVPTTPELHPTTPKEQPITPEPTFRATRGRAHRTSVKAHEPTVPTAPELRPTTPTEQAITPEPTSRATRGRIHRASVKTPEPTVPTTPELHPTTPKEQPITPEPTFRATRGRAHRTSVKAHEPTVPTAPELRPTTPTEQAITPEPTSRATRGRIHRASVKAPEPTVPTTPELHPTTPKEQPITPEPTSRATRGRTHRASVKAPEPTVPTAPELHPTTPTEQGITPEPTSRATRGRTHRASVKAPEPTVPTALELHPTTPKEQPITPEPTFRATRGRTHRASVKSPEPTVPTAPELHPTTSKEQPITPKPTSRATRGTHRASIKAPGPTIPTAPNLEPPTPTDQLVTSKAVAQGGQSRTLRSKIRSVPVSTTPDFQSPVPTDQPIPPEPIPQANCSRRQRVTRKHGSLVAPIVCEPCSAPLEPNSWSSRSQRRGAVKATESLGPIPEPAFAQLLEAPTHAPQIQKVEAAGRYEFTPESQSKAFQDRKRPSDTVDSPPLQKRLQRHVPRKTVSIKGVEEEPTEKPGKEEVRRELGLHSWERARGLRNSHQDPSQSQDIVMPGSGKRKKDQAEEEPKRMPGRSLRRTKPNHESTAPKVLFTGVVDARGEQAVLALGGSLASSVAEASHLVTDRICRTVKFLCAVGRGIPILSLDWLYQSRKAGCFLPPDEYVVTDPEQEKNFGFSLRDSLSRAREQRLLEGYEIHVTPGVQPPPPQMGEIISCCGGTVLPSMPRSYKPQRVVIACSQDVPRCTTPFRVGLPILSPEFLLTGVLKQEAKPEAFVLSPLEIPST